MSGSKIVSDQDTARDSYEVTEQEASRRARSSKTTVVSQHTRTGPQPESSSSSNNGNNNLTPNGDVNVHAALGQTDMPPPGHDEEAGNESNQDGEATTPTISLSRGILCAVALGCLIFFQATNVSMLTTIQSVIAADLNAYDKTSWFTSAYLITMSSLAPLNGKLSTIFSPRLCILVSSLILALGGVITGLAGNFEVFMVGRATAGVGAAGVLTLAVVLILELTGPKRRGLGVGMLNSGFTIGVALGAIAAGGLQPVLGWRALFYLQAPFCVVSGLVLVLAIPSTFTTAGSAPKTSSSEDDDDAASSHGTLTRLRSLDYLGATMLTVSIASLLYALSSPSGVPLLPLLLALLLLAIFVLVEVYFAADPIVPVSLLRSRGLLCTCLATVGFMMARWTVLFFSPTFALAVRHWSGAEAGAILMPTNAGLALGGLVAGALHIRRPGSFYAPNLVAYALFPVTLAVIAALANRAAPAWAFVVAVFICGLVTGAALNYSLAHLLHLTPARTHYVAIGLLATFRGFAGSFSSAIGGGLFTRALDAALREGFAARGLHRDALVQKLLGSPALVASLTGVEWEVAMDGYERALKTLFLAGAALAVVTAFVQAGAGWKAADEEPVSEERQPLLSDEEGEHVHENGNIRS